MPQQKTPRDSEAQRTSGSQPRVSRSERLDARITSQQKELISEAAQMFGMTTTQFVIQTAVRRARRLLRDEAIVRTNDRDREVLINALVAPPEPSEALQKAWRDYEDVTTK